jgi:hypothetical protein
MNIAELKAKLASGELTQEQFAEELKKLLDAGTITQEEHDSAVKGDSGQAGGMSAEDIKKLIQSETDKVRTEYAKKLKAEQDEKDRLLKEKMTDEEKARFEREKLQKDLEERERTLNAREVALHTIDKLTEAKLPLSFKDFLVAGSKEDADKNIEAFQKAWQAELKAAVDARFKDNGSTPPGQGGGTPTKKWSEMTLTEQGKLVTENPQLAKSLAAAAGIVLDI